MAIEGPDEPPVTSQELLEEVYYLLAEAQELLTEAGEETSPAPGAVPVAGRPGKRRTHTNGWQVFVAALLIGGSGVGAFLGGRAVGAQDHRPAPVVHPAHTQAPALVGGTRDAPFAIGDPVAGGDWQVTLGEPREAWDELRATSDLNAAPPEDMEYYVVPVSVIYRGSGTGLPAADLAVQFVGSDGRTYTEDCGGIVPERLRDVGELAEGSAGEGNVCLTVPAGADGLWTLRTARGGDASFFEAGTP